MRKRLYENEVHLSDLSLNNEACTNKKRPGRSRGEVSYGFEFNR